MEKSFGSLSAVVVVAVLPAAAAPDADDSAAVSAGAKDASEYWSVMQTHGQLGLGLGWEIPCSAAAPPPPETPNKLLQTEDGTVYCILKRL